MLLQHVVFLTLLIGSTAFFSWLDIRNVKYGERMLAERGDWVRDRFQEDPEEIAAYARATTGVSLLESWTVLTLVLVVLYSGVYTRAVSALYSSSLPAIVQPAVFFAGIAAGLLLIGRPFSAYSTFVVEELFEFNEQTPALFIRDTFVSLLISTVIAGLLGGALVWVVETFPVLWAIGGTLLFLTFALLMQVVYPRIIAPLFNDFTPLESGELREAVDGVFDRAGFECEQLYEMDASRRSSKSNAYFIGFGRTKRVVLFDTLIEQMNLEEIQAVLAHELAHWKNHHVWTLLAAAGVQVGVMLGLAQFLMSTGWLSEMFNVPAEATYGVLLIAFLWVYPLMQLSAPLQNRLSLAHERTADDYGASIAGVDAMVSSLQRLGGENLANPFPHPLYETFHYDHPPIPKRIRRLERGDER